MECYECAKRGTATMAVATCRDCSAGLCLGHVRETAVRMDSGSLFPVCGHDTWVPSGDPIAAAPSRSAA